MTLFSLKRDELKKVNNEFKKTYLGQSIYGLKICVQLFFVLVLIQQALSIYNDTFDMVITSILLCGLILSVIMEYFYLYFLNIYYGDKKTKK